MKKMITMVMALVLAVSMTACGNIKGNSTTEKTEQNAAMQTETISEEKQNEEEPENMMTGGWNIISGDMGITANPDAMQGISLVYVYQNLQGNAEITGSNNIIGEMLDGGFAANDGDIAPEKNADVKSAYVKAFAQFTGASYEPIAYLGSQIVAGTNYLLLCRTTAATPNTVPALTLVTIYADLNGNAEIINTEELTLGETETQTSEQESKEKEEKSGGFTMNRSECFAPPGVLCPVVMSRKGICNLTAADKSFYRMQPFWAAFFISVLIFSAKYDIL